MPRIPFIFPDKGQDENTNYPNQPPNTSSDCDNVRVFDSLLQRQRGGSRPGLSKWYFDTINGATRIQALIKGVEAVAISGSGTPFTILIPSAGTDAGDFEFAAFGTDYDKSNYTFTLSASLAGQLAMNDSGDFYLTGTGIAGGAGLTAKYNAAGASQWSNTTNGGTRCVYDNTNEMCVVYGAVADDDVIHGLQDSDGVSQWSFNFGVNDLFALALAAAGGFVYVIVESNTAYTGAGSAKSIFKIDTSDGSLAASFDTASGGLDDFHLCVGPQGQVAALAQFSTDPIIYLLDEDLNLITSAIVDTTGGRSTGASPRFGAFDSNGDLWVVDTSQFVHSITKLNGTTLAVKDGISAIRLSPEPFNVIRGIQIDHAKKEVVVVGAQFTTWRGAEGTLANGVRYDYLLNPVAALDLGVPDLTRDRVRLVNTSSSATTRQTSVTAVAEGDVFLFEDRIRVPVTSGDNVLVTTTFAIQGAAAYGDIFIVDGTNEVFLDLATNTVAAWTATTAGTIPTNPRLVARWRGRMVLAGLIADPHNWFMSRVGDPFDFDYSPATTDATQAVAGNIGETGLFGDIITALCPFDDDTLVVGMDQSIAKMSGDPAAGGAIDVITEQTGMAWDAWTIDPDNRLWFMGIDGIYMMELNTKPINMTRDVLDAAFEAIDLDTNRVLLEWDFRNKGLVVVVANVTSGNVNKAFFFENRTGGWFPMAWPVAMGPDFMLAYDDDKPEDKALLLGCRDGFIRQVNTDAATDDGTAIDTNVRFFPIGTRRGTDSHLHGLEVVLAESSANVTLKVYSGQTAEQCATSTTVRWSRVLTAGKNILPLPRLNGSWLQFEFVTTSGQWALESIFGLFEEKGRTRRTKR